jgi:hypothetical protein
MLVSVGGYGQVKFISSTAQAYKNNIRIAEKNIDITVLFYKNVICVTMSRRTKIYKILKRYKKGNHLYYTIESREGKPSKQIAYDTKTRTIRIINHANGRTTKLINLKRY